MLQQGARGAMTRCCLYRRSSGLFGASKSYLFCLDAGLAEPGDILASTNKKSSGLHTSYTIKCGNGDEPIGKLKSDSSGTEFVLFGPGVNASRLSLWDDDAREHTQVRQQLASISYSRTVVAKSTFLSATYGPRAVVCRLKVADLQRPEEATRAHTLRNKPPTWDARQQTWALDFGGRAPMVSSKNVQLHLEQTESQGEPSAEHSPSSLRYPQGVLQVGKVSRNAFTVDYTWPLTGLQALGIALSAFEPKRSSKGPFDVF